jgi:hypothetical protein
LIDISYKQYITKSYTFSINPKKKNPKLEINAQFHRKTRGVSHYGLCHLHLKNILRKMKNYGNSNISPCKNIILKKYLKRKPKSFKKL